MSDNGWTAMILWLGVLCVCLSYDVIERQRKNIPGSLVGFVAVMLLRWFVERIAL